MSYSLTALKVKLNEGIMSVQQYEEESWLPYYLTKR